MSLRLNRRDRAKVTRSRQLWRRVHDELRDANRWRSCREEWTFAGQILPGGIGIRAVLVGIPSMDGVAIRSHIEIRRHSRQDRVYVDEVRRILKARGYEQFFRSRPHETTFLNKSISRAELSAERRWLAARCLRGSSEPLVTTRNGTGGRRAEAWGSCLSCGRNRQWRSIGSGFSSTRSSWATFRGRS